MKRLSLLLLTLVVIFSCGKYDDSWLIEEIGQQQQRLEELEKICGNINDNISSLQKITSALDKEDYLTDIRIISENNHTIGYTFYFFSMGEVTVYNGTNGKNGENASYPDIGIKQYSDGKWYWTIDGDWLLDDNGGKISTLNEENITPLFKIEDDFWYVSYDAGNNWIKTGKASGEDSWNSGYLITSVIIEDDMVCIEFYDESEIFIPLYSRPVIILDVPETDLSPGDKFSIGYSIKGTEGEAEIVCVGEHGWKGEVYKEDKYNGFIEVIAPDRMRDGKIVVFASCNDMTVAKAAIFEVDEEEMGTLTVVSDYFKVDGKGGIVMVEVTTDQEYEIVIPEEARTWISYVETKSLRTESIILDISENRIGDSAREAVISLKSPGIIQRITIFQEKREQSIDDIDREDLDGMYNTKDGVVVLSEATKGSGTDIIIMGDGFAKEHFLYGGKYKELMEQTAEDFFSVEPYRSLKEYFNVYYINAVSEDNHDAVPYIDFVGAQNGATNGVANTIFNTTFTEGSTLIEGNEDMVLEYARQAIRAKGSPGGKECTDEDEVYIRANKALMIVMSNVACYAGTCSIVWTTNIFQDYGNAYSIAFISLGNDETGEQRKWTMIHEAGGHGFGKLADEYGSRHLSSFNTGYWYSLKENHLYGVYRNINEYWTEEEAQNWSSLNWEYTDETNVYWSKILDTKYDYISDEGLGIYEGGFGYSNMFCRPTENSIMRFQMDENGQFFNAISRWAIWYRLMRLTGSTDATNFKSSLEEFIAFDSTLEITMNDTQIATKSNIETDNMMPLAPPVLIRGEWRNGKLIK